MCDQFHRQCLQCQGLNLEHHAWLGKSSTPELHPSLRILSSNLPTNNFCIIFCWAGGINRGWSSWPHTRCPPTPLLVLSSCWALLIGRRLESLQQGKGPCLSPLTSRRALVLNGNTEVGSGLESQLLRRLSQESCKFKSSLGYWLSSRPT